MKKVLEMFFSDTSAISENIADGDGTVTIFTAGGVKVGQFTHLDEAKSQLRQGIYVVKNQDKTYKIAIQ